MCVGGEGVDTATLALLSCKPTQEILQTLNMNSPGLCQVNNPLSDLIQRGGDVLQQQWPTVDPKYLDVPEFVELSVMVGTNTH